jgi:hypothetical protein
MAWARRSIRSHRIITVIIVTFIVTSTTIRTISIVTVLIVITTTIILCWGAKIHGPPRFTTVTLFRDKDLGRLHYCEQEVEEQDVCEGFGLGEN